VIGSVYYGMGLIWQFCVEQLAFHCDDRDLINCQEIVMLMGNG
jgi:hypothetical protein